MKKIFITVILIYVVAGTILGQHKTDISFYTGMGSVPKPEIILSGDEIFTEQTFFSASIFAGIDFYHHVNSVHAVGLRLENGSVHSQMYELDQSYIDICMENDIVNVPANKKIAYLKDHYITKYTKYWSVTPQYRYRHVLSERNILYYNLGLELRHYIPYSVSNILAANYRDSLPGGNSIVRSRALPVKSVSYSNSKYLNGRYDRSQFISLGLNLGLTYQRVVGKAKKHALSIGFKMHYEPRYSIYSKYETTEDSPVYSKGIYMLNGHNVNLHLGYHWLF
ncbi:MAG: hypothetical protein ACOCPM_06300 [Bacteroidales bacterium]